MPSPNEVMLPIGAAFAAAPFFTIQRHESHVLLLNGRCHVLVREAGKPEVTVVVHELWSGELPEDRPLHAMSQLRSDADHEHVERAVAEVMRSLGHDPTASNDAQAVSLAKGVAEHGRNSVAELRQLRYEAERHLANSIADDSYDAVSLPALIELGIAAGRASDVAQRAARSGLWVHRFNDAVYHAHRRRMDPTLAARGDNDEVELPSWFRTLDAGVRQCQMMEKYLTDELEQLHRLVQATASISAARDVRAQEQFNFVATVGAVVLGLPALVLSVYGSRAGSDWPWAWVLPVVLCGVLACVVAWKIPGDLGTRRRRRAQAVVAAGVTFLLVCVAAGVPRLLVLG